VSISDEHPSLERVAQSAGGPPLLARIQRRRDRDRDRGPQPRSGAGSRPLLEDLRQSAARAGEPRAPRPRGGRRSARRPASH